LFHEIDMICFIDSTDMKKSSGKNALAKIFILRHLIGRIYQEIAIIIFDSLAIFKVKHFLNRREQLIL